jgi:transposase
MRTPIRVRELTDDEAETVKRLAHSRTEPARSVERAKIVWLSHEDRLVPAIAQELQLAPKTVRMWLKRFNADGLAGLEDAARSGRPATYTVAEVGEVIATALTNPQSLELPFASWTLDRLEAYLNETKGIAIKRSRIDEMLLAEGLRWRKQETWFGERVDPEFAEKRGALPGSTRSHPPEA